VTSADDKRARFHEARVKHLESEIQRLRGIVQLADRALKSLAPGMPFISFDVLIVNEAMTIVAKEAAKHVRRLE
jgi:hypothetical protein